MEKPKYKGTKTKVSGIKVKGRRKENNTGKGVGKSKRGKLIRMDKQMKEARKCELMYRRVVKGKKVRERKGNYYTKLKRILIRREEY